MFRCFVVKRPLLGLVGLVSLCATLAVSEVDAQACSSLVQDGIVSHYSSAVRDFSCGAQGEFTGEDAPVTFVPDPNTDCHPYWSLGLATPPNDYVFPTKDTYVAANFSLDAIGPSLVSQFCDRVEADTGIGVAFISASAFTPAPTDCSDVDRADLLASGLAQNQLHVQAIHGLVADTGLSSDQGSLFTVFLPPGWDEGTLTPEGHAEENRFPIVFQVVDDLAEWVFKFGGSGESDTSDGTYMAGLVALSTPTTGAGEGAIGVMWNGGGAKGSFTINNLAHSQFAEIVDFVAKQFGGNPDQVLMYGGSRSGSAAINLATNPHNDPLTVPFVAVSTAIGWWGQAFADLTNSPTYPVMYYNLQDVIGSHYAWGDLWEYTTAGSCFQAESQLVGMSAAEANSRIMTGILDSTVSLETIDDTVTAAAKAGRLKTIGTKVFVEVGTHDKLPYQLKMEYVEVLDALDVDYMAEIQARAGHGRRFADPPPMGPTPGPPLDQRQTQVLWGALEPCAKLGVCDFPLPTGDQIRYFEVDGELNNQKTMTERLNAEAHLPFTMEAPRRIDPRMEMSILLAGEIGTRYRISICPAVGSCASPILQTSGELLGLSVADDDSPNLSWASEHLRLAPNSLPVGDYLYQVEIRKTGGSWTTLEKTPADIILSDPLLEVELFDLSDNIDTIAGDITSLILRANGQSNWGLSEY